MSSLQLLALFLAVSAGALSQGAERPPSSTLCSVAPSQKVGDEADDRWERQRCSRGSKAFGIRAEGTAGEVSLVPCASPSQQ